jgi:hypothetical protein
VASGRACAGGVVGARVSGVVSGVERGSISVPSTNQQRQRARERLNLTARIQEHGTAHAGSIQQREALDAAGDDRRLRERFRPSR